MSQEPQHAQDPGPPADAPGKEPVHVDKEQLTMLFTLYARARQSGSKRPVLHDPWAEEAVSRLDVDFEDLPISTYDTLSIASRARQFDVWTAAFLAENPGATVLHLGCGLDSRVYRVAHEASVSWFDVDYPEVIELRRRLCPEQPGYRMIGSSLADTLWLHETASDRPVLVLAEGVTMYLTEDVVMRLLSRIVDCFPSGEVIFDAHSRWLVRFAAKTHSDVGRTGATFGWGVDDPREVTAREPRLSFVAEARTPDFDGFPLLPAPMRALLRVTDAVRPLRRMTRPLIYRF